VRKYTEDKYTHGPDKYKHRPNKKAKGQDTNLSKQSQHQRRRMRLRSIPETEESHDESLSENGQSSTQKKRQERTKRGPKQGTTAPQASGDSDEDSVNKGGTKEGTKAKRGTKEGTKPPQSSGDSDQDSVSSSDFMKPRLQVGGQKAATTRKRAMQNNTSDKHPDDSQAAVKRGTKEDTKSEQALVGGSDGACHWPQPSSSKSVGKHTTLCASNTPGGRSRGQPLSMRPASSKYIKVLGIHTVVLCDKVSLPKWCTAELGRLPDRHGAWPWMRVGEGEPPMGGSLRFIFHETAFSKRDVITYS